MYVVLARSRVYAEDYYYAPGNVTRTTLSGIQAYRSALTLDWLAAEDSRQRELVAAYETEPSASARVITTECIDYPKPSPGRVAKLMLELLKNLEGDDGILVPELIQVLVRARMIVETSMLDAEPDLDSLVKTPTMMMGEPHTTFPRILAIVWMLVTDTTATRSNGWCPLQKVNKYLISTKTVDIAQHLRVLEPVIARARFIMEEFIQNVTPLNMIQKKTKTAKPKRTSQTETVDAREKLHRSRDVDMLQDHQVQQDNLTLESDYSSTPLMEQARQADILEETEAVAKKCNAAKLAGLLNVLTISTSDSVELVPVERDQPSGEKLTYKLTKRQDDVGEACIRIKPMPRDTVRRVYAILPYFDKDHANTAFLHKYRATVHGMSEGEDLLDREAALYASILTPLVFLQQYRDTWCLLERVRSFILELPGRSSATRTAPPVENEDEEVHDKKDIRYLKELIKNLG
ncbi:unnamed protein product [Parnassius apollo]|uniref:(apollo) hypothetical protein n=1 Tax=Parnassius apollo TaxID=110799 RepID=A0A8S3W304_PARAO|nr:unnamed protein product [Parnassius apollo]